MKYDKPTVTRFGGFRDITRAGCIQTSDGATFVGAPGDVSTGSAPIITPTDTTQFCFAGRGSR